MMHRAFPCTWQGKSNTVNVEVRSLLYDEASNQLKMDTPRVTLRFSTGEVFTTTLTDYAHTSPDAGTLEQTKDLTPTYNITPNVDAIAVLDSLGLPAKGRQMVDVLLDGQYAAMLKANQLIGGGASAVPLVKTDLNRFLNDYMPLHVACWRPR